jgi:hypothetical protein
MSSKQVIVIGNGESRECINLHELKKNYILVGCNAVHRDINVEHLVCCDHRMIREVLKNPDAKDSLIYVRANWYQYFRKILKNKNIRLLPSINYPAQFRADRPEHWGSGPYAVLIAAQLNLPVVSLIGFDLYGNQGLVNNVYKGTQNYSAENKSAVDPNYWIYQIGKIFSSFPHIQFNIINTEEWKMPDEWLNENVKKESISVALQINTLYN